MTTACLGDTLIVPDDEAAGPLIVTGGNNLADLVIQPNAAPNGYTHEKFYLLCNLGSNVRFTGYSLGEYGISTNTP